jgi:hypothetical protein
MFLAVNDAAFYRLNLANPMSRVDGEIAYLKFSVFMIVAL